MNRNPFSIFGMRCAFVISLVSGLSSLVSVHAQTATDLQSKIDQRNSDITALEAQIKGYQTQIDSLGSQATSLASAIKSLDLSRKQLEARSALTQDQISATTYKIQQLASQISVKEGNINDDQRIVRQTFVALEQSGDQSIPTILLGSNSVGQAWDSLNALGALIGSIRDRIGTLNSDKAALETNKQMSEKAKSDLVALNRQLVDQRAIVLATSAEKNSLLTATNQSEASYRQLLADKKTEEAALQQEINQYEEQLHLLVHPNQIPHTGSGVLSWPLDSIRITQYFGNTPFATANPQVYGGMGHNGVDFAAAIGTPVKAALSGTVIGVEDTDLYPGCYSFGKWVMVKHANGLSTLYAHLSLQSVGVGQQVTTGQLIGYSGNTGYTTGPHLHFGVYATAGTVIRQFTNSLHCQGATIPIADFSAYLNPLSYL
jgi:murein DD-endopeptidase MepM/ murein hydrolase activator NlpD